MKYVHHILKAKGDKVWSVGGDVTVYDALKLMADKGIGALLVIENEKILGIFSERDYARKVVLQGRSSKDMKISEIMSRNVCIVHAEQTVEECMALMTEKHIRHLPVLEGEKLLGIISIGDVVKAFIAEKEFIIKELENYITGRPST